MQKTRTLTGLTGLLGQIGRATGPLLFCKFPCQISHFNSRDPRRLTVDRFPILVGGTTDGLCCWRDRDGGGCNLGMEWVVSVKRRTIDGLSMAY